MWFSWQKDVCSAQEASVLVSDHCIGVNVRLNACENSQSSMLCYQRNPLFNTLFFFFLRGGYPYSYQLNPKTSHIDTLEHVNLTRKKQGSLFKVTTHSKRSFFVLCEKKKKISNHGKSVWSAILCSFCICGQIALMSEFSSIQMQKMVGNLFKTSLGSYLTNT